MYGQSTGAIRAIVSACVHAVSIHNVTMFAVVTFVAVLGGVRWDVIIILLYAYGCTRLDSDSCWAPFQVVKKRSIVGKLSRSSELGDLDVIRAWAVDQHPTRDTTSHWWVSQLGAEAQRAFRRIERSESVYSLFNSKFDPIEYDCAIVSEMNEVYVSGPNRSGTSDRVFFTEHIDGPFPLFPFASVYRCIVGMDDNVEISTHFPNTRVAITAQKGDVIAFDFNREPHYIASDETNPNKNHRIVLKLHYCLFPKRMCLLGCALQWMTTTYDRLFRQLFLFALEPSTKVGTFCSWLINTGTYFFNHANRHVGLGNIVYVASWAYVAQQERRLFFIMTQYVHYVRYITTYYARKDVDYMVFRRDVVFFKCVALLQIGVMAIQAHRSADVRWAFLIALGYGISACAVHAIGLERTYFGRELGMVSSDDVLVKSFPYNVVPHPMLVGQIIGLVGIHQYICSEHPLLIPLHIAFYVAHLIQEIFDIHDGRNPFACLIRVAERIRPSWRTRRYQAAQS